MMLYTYWTPLNYIPVALLKLCSIVALSLCRPFDTNPNVFPSVHRGSDNSGICQHGDLECKTTQFNSTTGCRCCISHSIFAPPYA